MGTSSAMLPPQSQNDVLAAEPLFPAEIMLPAWGAEGGAGKSITVGYLMHKTELSAVLLNA